MTKGKRHFLIWRCATKILPKVSFFHPENEIRNLTRKEHDMAVWLFRAIHGQQIDLNSNDVWAMKIYTEKGFDYRFEYGSWSLQCELLTADVVAFGYLGQ